MVDESQPPPPPRPQVRALQFIVAAMTGGALALLVIAAMVPAHLMVWHPPRRVRLFAGCCRHTHDALFRAQFTSNLTVTLHALLLITMPVATPTALIALRRSVLRRAAR